MSSFAEQTIPFVAASVVAVGIALAGVTVATPRYDAWQADLAAAQAQAAEERAQAEAEAAAAAEEDRRQRAAQALSMSMGGGGAPSAAAQPGGGFNPLAPASTGNANANQGWDGPRAEEFGNLPDTEGVQTVYQNCTWCHSQSLFTQQTMTPDRWDYTLDWMVTDGGMPELPEEDREVIYDYLVRHYSSG